MPNGKKPAPEGQEPAGASNEKLNKKEKLFVAEYLKHFNGAKAAIAAGYSEKSARSIASQLLTKINISAKVSAAHAARVEKIGKDADDVARELALIGFARMGRFAKVKSGRVEFTETEDLEEEGLDAAIESYSESTTEHGGSVAIKLHNKIKALELYGKHIGMWKEKVNDGSDEDKKSSSTNWDSIQASIEKLERGSE